MIRRVFVVSGSGRIDKIDPFDRRNAKSEYGFFLEIGYGEVPQRDNIHADENIRIAENRAFRHSQEKQ